MSTTTAGSEVVNTTLDSIFTNTVDFDLAMYASTSNQDIHFGTLTGTQSALFVNSSNLTVNNNIALSQYVAFNSLRVNRKALSSDQTNLSSVGLPCLVSNSNQLTFTLSNGQSNILFMNSNNTQIASIDQSGNLAIQGGIGGANNLGMFRNRIINGNMRIAQRGSRLVTGTGSAAVYLNDRFNVQYNITTGGFTQSNIALGSSDAPFQQAGHRNAWRIQATTANTNFAWITPAQSIEGYHISDFNWGTATGSNATLSFWFRTNLAANSFFSVCLRNHNASHSYATPVYVNSNAVWQYFSTVIPPPPNGSTWVTNNGTGVQIMIGTVASGYTTTSSNVWLNANILQLTGTATSWATLNHYLDLTGVQFEKGSIATPFEYRHHALELALCQRYYEVVTKTGGPWAMGSFGTTAGGTAHNITFSYKEPKRGTPSITSGSIVASQGSIATSEITTTDATYAISANAGGVFYHTLTAPFAVSADI